MKKIIFLLMTLLSLTTVTTGTVSALTEDQADAIQSILEEASQQSGAPGITLAIVQGEDTYTFVTGYADREADILADASTYFELASVSKSYTAMGILLLEEQGLLAMTDPIQEYLPWLQFNYQGEPVDMTQLTLNHFMYHTSGITNNKHFQDIPQGDSEDMLYQTVANIQDAELEFPPGEMFQYGTVNYDVLGLVIEEVSGKSYEDFMREEILTPLGLHHTFLYSAEATAEGQMARGYRTTLFITNVYDAPVYAGNKPAGYIISNAEDMIRWMQIHVGLVDEIPDVFKVVVDKSHQGNQTVPEDYGQYYGGGWFVAANETLIEHGGVNPNFSTQVTLFPDDNLGITSLGNHADINHLSLVEGIQAILDGNQAPSYQKVATQISNIAMSSATIIISLLALVIILFAILNKNKEHKKRSKSRKATIVWGVITLILIVGTISLAGLLGYEWPVLLVWQPYSLLTFLLSLILLAGSITLLTWMRRSTEDHISG